ncbi:MAG: MFS transporter [Prevotella sp.]|uniref:MFS transporter n=1 Tax=Leyella stercorea TaxID=363265 RepID=UPI0028017AD6|nr:MFS transporter [Leyella stercorea]MDY4089506.1 MFS transporter [Prevotella sp.]MDY4401096.1 MFS transporter [Prevotella sp.]MDY4923863.1 MFS transporter [Prevotella sp.]
MIIINGKLISAIRYGEIALSAVYKGATLVWQAVRSCFGSGKWIANKPWLGKEGWRYGK